MMDEESLQMTEDCVKRREQLSEWEESFINDLHSQLKNNGVLTQNQDHKLYEIWERATKNG